MGRRSPPAALLLLLLLLLAAVPSAFSAASSPPKKPKAWGFSSSPSPPPPPPSPSAAPPRLSSPASSAIFPLYGDVYPSGLYYVSMMIGDPPKPYFLDVDTGSDLTWLQCDAPCVSCAKGPHPLYKPARNRLVPCEHRLCVAVHESTQQNHRCGEDSHQCDYEIQYADNWSSIGVLVADKFNLRLANSSVASTYLAFGCGYDQEGAGATAPAATDGVLGLGSGKPSVLTQLKELGVTKNVVGHCLSRKGGGYLFFGDDLVPSHGFTWAPMTRVGFRNYYSPGPMNLYLGKQTLGMREPVVFDSGSSYTYFTNQPYQAFLSAVKKDLSNKPLKEAFEDTALPVCWKGPKPFKSILDVKKYFGTLLLSFVTGHRAQMEIPPENYLIVTKHGNACLGVLNGTEVGLKDLNLIGDVSLQDLMVVYDNEKQQIGWARTNCNRLPKSGTATPSPLAEDDVGGPEGLFMQPHFAAMSMLPGESPARYNPKKV